MYKQNRASSMGPDRRSGTATSVATGAEPDPVQALHSTLSARHTSGPSG